MAVDMAETALLKLTQTKLGQLTTSLWNPPKIPQIIYCPNVSTTPLRQWDYRQCLPFSWTTLRGKHCWHPIAVMGVVDTFGPYVTQPH